MITTAKWYTYRQSHSIKTVIIKPTERLTA